LTILSELGARDAANASWQRGLVFGHITVGDILGKSGDWAAAVAELRSGIAIAEDLTEKAPSNADWQSTLSFAH
jgi:hypothetical protein